MDWSSYQYRLNEKLIAESFHDQEEVKSPRKATNQTPQGSRDFNDEIDHIYANVMLQKHSQRSKQVELGEQQERPPPRPPSGTKPPEARSLRSTSYNQGDMRVKFNRCQTPIQQHSRNDTSSNDSNMMLMPPAQRAQSAQRLGNKAPAPVPSTTFYEAEVSKQGSATEDAYIQFQRREVDDYLRRNASWNVQEVRRSQGQSMGCDSYRAQKVYQQQPERDQSVTTQVPVHHSPVQPRLIERRTESRSPSCSRRLREGAPKKRCVPQASSARNSLASCYASEKGTITNDNRCRQTQELEREQARNNEQSSELEEPTVEQPVAPNQRIPDVYDEPRQMHFAEEARHIGSQRSKSYVDSKYCRNYATSPSKIPAPKPTASTVRSVAAVFPLHRRISHEHSYSNRDYLIGSEVWAEVPEAYPRPKFDQQSLMRETYNQEASSFRYASQSPSVRSSYSSKGIVASTHGLMNSRSSSVVRSRPDSMLANPYYQKQESFPIVDYQEVIAQEPNFGDASILQWESTHSSTSSRSYVVSRGTDTGIERPFSKPSQTEVLEITVPDPARSPTNENDLRLDLGSMRGKPETTGFPKHCKNSTGEAVGIASGIYQRENFRTAKILEIDERPQQHNDWNTKSHYPPNVKNWQHTSSQRNFTNTENGYKISGDNSENGVFEDRDHPQCVIGYHEDHLKDSGLSSQERHRIQTSENDQMFFQHESEVQDQQLFECGQGQFEYQNGNNLRGLSRLEKRNQEMAGYGQEHFTYQEENVHSSGGQDLHHGHERFPTNTQCHFRHHEGNLHTFKQEQLPTNNQQKSTYQLSNVQQNDVTASRRSDTEKIQAFQTPDEHRFRSKQDNVQRSSENFEEELRDQFDNAGGHTWQSDRKKELEIHSSHIDYHRESPALVLKSETSDSHQMHQQSNHLEANVNRSEEKKHEDSELETAIYVEYNKEGCGMQKVHDSKMKVSSVKDSKYTIKRIEEWVIKSNKEKGARSKMVTSSDTIGELKASNDLKFEEKKEKIDEFFNSVKNGIDHAEERMMMRTKKQTVNQQDVSMMRHHEGEAAAPLSEFQGAELWSVPNRGNIHTPQNEDDSGQFIQKAKNWAETSVDIIHSM